MFGLDRNSHSEVIEQVPLIEPGHGEGESHRGIALALGGGVARGWAHIGILRALDEAQIPIKMIAGTSVGALVGGCYMAGKPAFGHRHHSVTYL